MPDGTVKLRICAATGQKSAEKGGLLDRRMRPQHRFQGPDGTIEIGLANTASRARLGN
jgi:hypothetical protein